MRRVLLLTILCPAYYVTKKKIALPLKEKNFAVCDL